MPETDSGLDLDEPRLIPRQHADFVESAAPVGSAPKVATDTDPAGCVSGGATFSKSAKSMVYDEAVEFASTCSLNLVPAG